MNRIVLFSIVIFSTVLHESNGNGNGCEWSGCREFATSHCKTGVTGGSGRNNIYNTRSCGFLGRKDFCCDDDCGYADCGAVISGTKFTDEVARISCGVASQQSFKEFVCGRNGVIPSGISVSGRRGNGFVNSGDGSSFRPIAENRGVGSEGFRSSNRGGFRSGSKTSNTANTDNSNGGFRSSGNGFRT